VIHSHLLAIFNWPLSQIVVISLHLRQSIYLKLKSLFFAFSLNHCSLLSLSHFMRIYFCHRVESDFEPFSTVPFSN
jgi:hypothetical protein